MERSIDRRVKRIQTLLRVPADGIIGSATLTALEARLFSQSDLAGEPRNHSLTVSRKGLEQLVSHEISSRSYYNKYLSKPIHPGGQSGVTIGIGYDLGYNSAAQIRKDWNKQIDEVDLDALAAVAGLKGEAAEAALDGLEHIRIELSAAEHVFHLGTLPRFAAMTLKAYPGCDELHADAQAGMLSLVYNRGTRMSGSTRKEMKAIQPLVLQKDYAAIAEQVVAMKRLWAGKNLDGLLKRRDDEARLIGSANRIYDETEFVNV